MHSSVVVHRMPVTATNRAYQPNYTSSYSSSSYSQPSTLSRYRSNTASRIFGFDPPSSSTPSYKSTTSSYKPTTTSSYKPTTTTASSVPRRLPAGSGPLDSSGQKLVGYSHRHGSSSSSSSSNQSRPLKADHSSVVTNDYGYGTSSLSQRRTSSRDMQASGSTGRFSGRRSSSLYTLSDIDNLNIGETSKYSSSRTGRDATSVTTPRRSSYYRDEDIGGVSSRTSSRTSRISISVDRENVNSPVYAPRSQSISSRNLSRESSPVRDRIHTPTRRCSVDLRESPSSKTVSRQGSNSSITSKCSSGGKTGLRNLGNTCFMNSIIQCLSNTRPLLEYCLKDDYHMDINDSTSSMKGALMKAYANIMQSMWKANDSYVSPNSFKTQIQKFAPRFMGYAQQDSQEFLRYLLEGLHEDVNKVTSKPKPIVLEDEKLERKSDSEKSYEYWRTYLNFDNSKIVDIFVGQLKSELKFKECGHRSVTFDPFWDLSLPIPKNRYEVSLQDCFRLFMKEEELQDDPMCTKCKQRRSCTKGFSIQKFPKILVIHLKRFSQERYGRKLSTCVEYPTSSLDLGSYSADRGSSTVKYNLYAVSNHSGGVHSGHYTAICRHPYTGEWQNFNDTSVTAARSNQAVSSEGYILFYEQAERS